MPFREAVARIHNAVPGTFGVQGVTLAEARARSEAMGFETVGEPGMDAPENVGFAIAAWLYGNDFGERLVLANSAGEDTDCTCATLGAILGIIDGASGLQKWWYITIPNMKPTFTFMIMMLTISTLRRFDDVWMIGGSAGNPAGKLDTMVMYIFRNSWLSREVGVASAAAVVLFVITMTLTILNNYVFNRND